MEFSSFFTRGRIERFFFSPAEFLVVKRADDDLATFLSRV